MGSQWILHLGPTDHSYRDLLFLFTRVTYKKLSTSPPKIPCSSSSSILRTIKSHHPAQQTYYTLSPIQPPYFFPPMAQVTTSLTFLDLPPEIRNIIYTLALTESGDNSISICRGSSHLSEPALTRTCNQIRQESLPVFYGTNRFFDHLSGALYAVQWLQSIGVAHRHLLRCVSILTSMESKDVTGVLGSFGVEVREGPVVDWWAPAGKARVTFTKID